jgi:hypothetical protein
MLSYYEEVYRDVKDLLANESELQEMVEAVPLSIAIERLYDALSSDSWSDSVTGNASGSYSCNAYEAMKMVLDNTVDVAKAYIDLDIASEMAEDFNNERWKKLM